MKPLLALLLFLPIYAEDWPQWRGINRDNKSSAHVVPITEWSAEKNVRWKTPIPGRGHSTPIVVGNEIFLTTCDLEKERQSLIAFDRKSGKILWNKTIHQGKLPAKVHGENSRASATAQWTGKHLLTTFENDGNINVSAVSRTGEIIWSKSVGSYKPHYEFGYGSTPTLHKGLFIVSIGAVKEGSLIAIDAESGEEKWRTPREGHDNWSSPVVAEVAGKEQLFISGIGKIQSYDPLSGKLNWDAPLKPLSTCGTIVWTDDSVFASGGFPKNETAGVKADGSGEVLWSNSERCYEQSLLAHDGFIYAVTDKGVGFCWRAEDGKEMWNARIGRGGVMASPTLANNLLFSTLKNGTTVVYRATSEGFQEVAENKLGDDTYASPVMVDDELYLRPGFVNRGQRQEFLYCLGKQPEQ